jgi:uncharacterized membrane protein
MHRLAWCTTMVLGLVLLISLTIMTAWHCVVLASNEQPVQAIVLLGIGVMTIVLLSAAVTFLLDAITRREIRARVRSNQ